MVREAPASALRTVVDSRRSRAESHGSARTAGALSTTRCHAVRFLVREAVPGSERGFVVNLKLPKEIELRAMDIKPDLFAAYERQLAEAA